MWRTKYFKTFDLMAAWVNRNDGRIQYTQIFICDGYGIEYRPLRKFT